MVVVIMGQTPAARTAVAAAVAEMLGWGPVHVSDDFGRDATNRIEVLRARMSASLSAGRAVVYSCPQLSQNECRALRESLRDIELVRLSEPGENLPSMTTALTLDGAMSAAVLAATMCAILRLEAVPRKSR